MKQTFLILIAILSFLSCSDDDSNDEQQPIIQSHIIEFSADEYQASASIFLTTTLNLDDGTESTINSDFDYDQNIVSVEIPENTVSFELEFYIEDSSEAQMRFYGAENDVTIHQETINQQTFQYQYTFN